MRYRVEACQKAEPTFHSLIIKIMIILKCFFPMATHPWGQGELTTIHPHIPKCDLDNDDRRGRDKSKQCYLFILPHKYILPIRILIVEEQSEESSSSLQNWKTTLGFIDFQRDIIDSSTINRNTPFVLLLWFYFFVFVFGRILCYSNS